MLISTLQGLLVAGVLAGMVPLVKLIVDGATADTSPQPMGVTGILPTERPGGRVTMNPTPVSGALVPGLPTSSLIWTTPPAVVWVGTHDT
jgi:hypothetical protein